MNPVVLAQEQSLTEWFADNWLPMLLTTLQVVVLVVVTAVVVRYARRGVAKWVSRATTRTLERADQAKQVRAELRARTLGKVMAEVTALVIWAIALATALAMIGLPLGPILAGAGIVGVALGFGAQSLVKDFLSGFFILLEDQYGVGDNIRIGELIAGRVEDITLRVTRVRSIDGTVWFVPNGEIRELGNRSKEWSRALVDIEVAYGEDVDEVIPVIEEVAAELRRDPEFGPKILEDIEILGVEELGTSGVTIRTYLKTLPLEQFPVARRFRQDVKRAFDGLGIEIPFPHQKVVFADDDQDSPARRMGRAKERSDPRDT